MHACACTYSVCAGRNSSRTDSTENMVIQTILQQTCQGQGVRANPKLSTFGSRIEHCTGRSFVFGHISFKYQTTHKLHITVIRIFGYTYSRTKILYSPLQLPCSNQWASARSELVLLVRLRTLPVKVVEVRRAALVGPLAVVVLNFKLPCRVPRRYTAPNSRWRFPN